jgi:hypothetical protein
VAGLPRIMSRIWALLFATCFGACSNEIDSEGKEVSRTAKAFRATAGKSRESRKCNSRLMIAAVFLSGEGKYGSSPGIIAEHTNMAEVPAANGRNAS